MYANLDVIPPPGMATIKQCKMYTNLRHIVPDENIFFYPKPTEDIVDTNKKPMATKRNGKAKRKKGENRKIETARDENKIEGGVTTNVDTLMQHINVSNDALLRTICNKQNL